MNPRPAIAPSAAAAAALTRSPALACAILAFAAWQSAELLNAWRQSPLDRLGWIAFLVWLTPALAAVLKPTSPTARPASTWLLAASLGASVIGILADFNTASYFGLACAVAALGGWSWKHALWLAASVAWMPAFSWAGQGLPRAGLVAARILVTGVLTAPALWHALTVKSPHPSP